MSPIPSTTDTLTIREMCEAFAVTPRTLRFYEAKELLFPIRKGVQRLFTRADRARLKPLEKPRKPPKAERLSRLAIMIGSDGWDRILSDALSAIDNWLV